MMRVLDVVILFGDRTIKFVFIRFSFNKRSSESPSTSVPITEKNIISLGIQQPTKLNQVLKTCIANNVNTPICAKVTTFISKHKELTQFKIS